MKLEFAELKRVQAGAPNAEDPNAILVAPYIKKIELLRKRLDSVSYTMNRVQVRLEGLQDVVTRSEVAQRRHQLQV